MVMMMKGRIIVNINDRQREQWEREKKKKDLSIANAKEY